MVEALSAFPAVAPPAEPLTIWHIGGDGAIGPAQCVIDAFPNTVLTTFDARPEVGLPVCFDETDGEADFYVNAAPMSSSLLRACARDEQVAWGMEGGGIRIERWADLTRVDHVERVRTTTVDAWAAGRAPDLLSIDAQGAELRILRGAAKTLPRILALVTEVEFWPLYEGQGLFGEQAALLAAAGFRLAGIENLQYWHTGKPQGEGWLTVGEAVWLRFVADLEPQAAMRLALLAYAFKRYSYMKQLAEKALAQCAP